MSLASRGPSDTTTLAPSSVGSVSAQTPPAAAAGDKTDMVTRVAGGQSMAGIPAAAAIDAGTAAAAASASAPATSAGGPGPAPPAVTEVLIDRDSEPLPALAQFHAEDVHFEPKDKPVTVERVAGRFVGFKDGVGVDARFDTPGGMTAVQWSTSAVLFALFPVPSLTPSLLRSRSLGCYHAVVRAAQRTVRNYCFWLIPVMRAFVPYHRPTGLS
jgi:hypothetical protein